MKRFIMAGVVIFSMALFSQAQNKFTLHPQIYTGLLSGGSGTAWQFQAIAGWKVNNWWAGAGTGIDQYYLRSIPLFLSLNRNAMIGRFPLFLSLDLGTSFAWLNYIEKEKRLDLITYHFSPQLYWNGSMGYRLPVGKTRNSLLFSIGYSVKHIKEKQVQPVFCINPPCPELTEWYNYRTRRFSLRMGWEF